MNIVELLMPEQISEKDTSKLLLAAKEYFYFMNIENLHIVFRKLRSNEVNIIESEFYGLYLIFLFRYFLATKDKMNAELVWQKIENLTEIKKEERSIYQFAYGLRLMEADKAKEAKGMFTNLAIDMNDSQMFYYEEVLYYLAYIKSKYFCDYEDSIINAKQALSGFQCKLNNYMSICTLLILTRNYTMLNQIDKVEGYIEILIHNKEIERLVPDKVLVLYHHIAVMYEKKGDLTNSLFFYKKVVENEGKLEKTQYLRIYFSYCYFLYDKLKIDSLVEFKRLLELSKEIQSDIGEFLATYFIFKLENREKEAMVYLSEKCYILEDESIVPELSLKLQKELEGVLKT